MLTCAQNCTGDCGKCPVLAEPDDRYGEPDDAEEPTPFIHHTPGPWHAGGALWDNDKVFAGRTLIATVHDSACSTDSNTGVTRGYNAQLIAAAPDLLAALDFMVRAAETEPAMSIYKAHIAAARAAIEKAHGGM